jgi:hypothetical protein
MQSFLPVIINCSFVPYFCNNTDNVAAHLTPIVCGLNMTVTFSWLFCYLKFMSFSFILFFWEKIKYIVVFIHLELHIDIALYELISISTNLMPNTIQLKVS